MIVLVIFWKEIQHVGFDVGNHFVFVQHWYLFHRSYCRYGFFYLPIGLCDASENPWKEEESI